MSLVAAVLLAVGVLSLVGARRGGRPVVGANVPATAMSLSAGPANNSPELASDPTNPRFVVLANRRDSPSFGCALQLSGDGGASWVPAEPVPKLPAGASECYAPQVAFDRAGLLYYLFVGLAGAGNQPVGAFLTTSSDRGRTFSSPRRLLGPENYGVQMAMDRSFGSRGRLHLVWLHASAPVALGGLPPTDNPILSEYSDDGGASFSRPERVSDPSRHRVVAPALALGPNHGVYVAYFDLGNDSRDYEGLAGPVWPGPWSLVMAASTDGGASYSAGEEVDDGLVPGERVMLIFTMPPPALVAWADRVCLAWDDARNGDDDVFTRCGAPSGRAWGPAIRVNQDRVGNGHRQYLPALSVSPGGRLDIAYLDRPDPLGITNQAEYSYSIDGGRTFAPSVALADTPSSAFVGTRYGVHSARDQVEFGSRLGLMSSSHGVLAAWPDTRNSSHSTDQDVFTAEVGFTAAWDAPRVAIAASAAVLAVLVAALALHRSPSPSAKGKEEWGSPQYGCTEFQQTKGKYMIIRMRTALFAAAGTIGAVLLATVALAYACTTYQGKLTVTTGSASSVSQGDDNCNHSGGCGFPDGSMTFCSVSLGAHLPHGTGGSATVSMGTTNTCTGSGQVENHLAANTTYDINIIYSDAMSSSDVSIQTSEDCMSWNGGSITHLTTATTDSNGAFSKSVTVPSGRQNSSGWYSGLCVSDQGSTSNYGNETGLQLT